MTTKPNVGNRGAQDANPDVSGSTVEGGTAQLLEIVAGLANEVKSLKSNISGIYSRQDKDRNQLRDFMDDFKQFKAGGMTDDAAYTAAESNQTARTLVQRLEKLESLVTQPTGNGAVDAAKVIATAGLDVNDPKVKLMASRNYANETELYAAIGQHVASTPIEHSSAQDPSSVGRGKGSQPSEDEMSRELLELYNNPTQHEARIKELETKLGW